MAEYIFNATESDTLATFKTDYIASLATPLDGMWQTFAAMANQFAIVRADEIVGYCAVDDAHKLLQFHLAAGHEPQHVFTAAIDILGIIGAIVATGETQTLSLCMDRQKSVTLNAILYELAEPSNPAAASFPEGARFCIVEKTELEAAVSFAHAALGADRDWLSYYYTNLIGQGALFGLWLDGDLIATGERRPSNSQKAYADVGMIVSPTHRGKGIATNMLRALIQICQQEGHAAICSTEVDNFAARKAIENAGFVARQRLLEIGF